MIPELGHLFLIVAFIIAIALFIIPMAGSYIASAALMRLSLTMTKSLFVAISISMFSLAWAFWVDDFSVIYIARNSNLELPHYYKLSALWSAHEGSLLLWAWLLSSWMLAVAIFKAHRDLVTQSRTLAVLGAVAAGFLAFMLFTSNPFMRHLPFSPSDGSDLNPLLQDIGLIIHPPMLYLGYVGLAVPFSYAVAALLNGRFDMDDARSLRPWTLAAWLFLTLGIALGSWWAYYELGWGGWWFWDPVENASFMPWLTATALLHAIATTARRNTNKNWTLFLAIMGFSLSLLGTFLVRSGVLTSVHAFASDPSRGYFILAFLCVVTGGSLILFALKGDLDNTGCDSDGMAANPGLTRESLLLVNNVLLVIMAGIVLLGTLYPLIADALNLGKISVGPPYFNFFFVPLMSLVILLMPLGSLVQWKNSLYNIGYQKIFVTAAICLLLALLFSWLYEGDLNITTIFFVTICLWALLMMLSDAFQKSRWHASFVGMLVAHVGVIVCVAGVALTVIYSKESDVRMSTGQQIEISGYEFVLEDIKEVKGPNYVATVGQMTVYQDGKLYRILHPEKRSYNSDRENKMTEAAIDAGLFRDIYVAMGEAINPAKGADSDWAMRIHYKPFVRWIWLGAIIMAAGSLICLLSGISKRST